MALHPISDAQGQWASYTPALTADTTDPTLGSGSSVTGFWRAMGDLVVACATINFGTSGVAAGSGNYRVSMPVARHSGFSGIFFGYVQLFDSSGATRKSGAVLAGPSATTVYMVRDDASGFVADNGPWVWAASDTINLFCLYRA